jgi:hypothetical protein
MIDFGINLVLWLASLLPAVPGGLAAVQVLVPWWSWVDSWFPLHELGEALALYLGLYVGLVGARAVVWAYEHIPLIG